jgi:hypothetical protein
MITTSIKANSIQSLPRSVSGDVGKGRSGGNGGRVASRLSKSDNLHTKRGGFFWAALRFPRKRKRRQIGVLVNRFARDSRKRPSIK